MNKFILVGIILIANSSCRYTNTPQEYLYQNKATKSMINHDSKEITKALDTIVRKSNRFFTTGTKLEYLDFYVDTIFYGPENQMWFIVISKKRNEYAAHFPNEYPDQIEY